MAPIAKMYTLGHSFVPPPVHAGGLRYHGMAPIVSLCQKLGIIETRAVAQLAVFQAALQFARTEGIIPAPEPSHAIKVVIDEALKCKESGEKKTILLGLSGHGHFDLGAYEEYISGKLTDYPYPEEKIKEALAKLPDVKL
jgi:tryptophan synthase beta chain